MPDLVKRLSAAADRRRGMDPAALARLDATLMVLQQDHQGTGSDLNIGTGIDTDTLASVGEVFGLDFLDLDLLLVAAAPAALRVHLTVFALAIVIGYYVIGNVHHALHTPLMSVTNAISGIIVVGALLQIGHGDTAITTLSFVAILLASINVFGGFAVTRRMLSMFSRS